MRTYLNTQDYPVATADDIKSRGEDALSRALNIGRVVAFTASGSTMEYGRPSWTEVVEFVISRVHDRKSNQGNAKSTDSKLDAIRREFEDIASPENKLHLSQALQDNSDFITSFFGICEDLYLRYSTGKKEKKLDAFRLRCEIAEFVGDMGIEKIKEGIEKKLSLGIVNFSAEENELIKKHQYYTSYNPSGISRGSSDVRIVIKLLLLARKISKQSNADVVLVESWLNELRGGKIDIIKEIYDELDIKRYLTLNYDIELEKFMATRLANQSDPAHDAFLEFLDFPAFGRNSGIREDSNNRIRVRNYFPEPEVELKNGMQQAIRSSSITSDSLVNLFNFGAFPSNFHASVFHLHGRVDDPENIILTQKDYTKLYLQSLHHRRAFEEARHAVFNGSDIIFIGCGMSESDVLAPLRDFMAQYQASKEVPGRVYAILLASTSGDAQVQDKIDAQKLYKHYGVYTLFAGGDEHLDSQATSDKGDGQKKKIITVREKRKVFKALKIKLLNVDNEDISWNELYKELESLDGMHCAETKLAQSILSHLVKEKSEPDQQALRLVADVVDSLENRLSSRAILNKITEIAKNKVDWWEKWQGVPKYRLALYGKLASDEEETLVWVRNKVDYSYEDFSTASLLKDTSEIDGISFYRDYFKQIRSMSAPPTARGFRIKRAVFRLGGGKGGLSGFLSKISVGSDEVTATYPFEYLFSENGEKVSYYGGFFSHLTFTLEFSSTIFALVRFIVKAANLNDDKLSYENITGYQPDRKTGISLLKLALSKLAERRKTQGVSKRLFICLSGLDRLVNQRGDAFSPVHREFFRVLTDKADKTKAGQSIEITPQEAGGVGIDLLLISSPKQPPIRYLSDEVLLPRSKYKRDLLKKNCPDVHVNNEKYYFREDRDIYIKKWRELSVPDFNVMLITALACTKKSLVDFQKSGAARGVFDLREFSVLEEAVQGFFGEMFDKGSAGLNEAESLRGNLKHLLHKFISTQFLYTNLFVRLLCWRFISGAGLALEDINQHLGRINIAIGAEGGFGYLRQIRNEFRSISDSTFLQAWSEDKGFTPGVMAVPGNLTDIILRHLALFGYPVQSCVLLSCPDIEIRLNKALQDFSSRVGEGENNGVSAEELLNLALSQLNLQGLIIKVGPWEKEDTAGFSPERSRYILHRDISTMVAKDMSYITQYTLSTAPYQATFYCAQSQSRLGVPKTEHFEFVSNLIEAVLAKIHRHWNGGLDDVRPDEIVPLKTRLYKDSAILRGAYATLRGSFSIGAISRIDSSKKFDKQPYEVYLAWVEAIISCAKELSVQHDRIKTAFCRIKINESDKQPDKAGSEEKTAAFMSEQSSSYEEQFDADCHLPFYRDEVAWLYNEQGVVCFMQGRLFDAISLYYQALTVLKLKADAGEDQSVDAPRRRVQVNLAITRIERGEIHAAVELLDTIINEIQLGYYSTPSMTLTFAKGYRALCDHLTGNFTQAEAAYHNVIDEVLAARQLRAASIFQRHLADLLRVREQMDEAKDQLLLSEKSALQAQQEDILHYSLLAKARLMRDLRSRGDALSILRRTEDYAKKMGLHKMFAETLKVRAEVMLEEGEVTQAGKMSAQAVAIFKRNGMRLRKISSALLHANVYAKRGQLDFAEKILGEIDQEASQLGYTLKTGAAQRFRQTLYS